MEHVAEPESLVAADPQSATLELHIRSMVSLEDIISNYPALSLSRLETIPDDQMLVFWAEHTHFRVTPPVVSEGEPPEPWMDIRDPSTGDIAGSCRCYEDIPSNTQDHMQDFILIGTNSGLQGEEKFVLGVEQTGLGGVWSRQCAGRIGEDDWTRVERRTMLVLLR